VFVYVYGNKRSNSHSDIGVHPKIPYPFGSTRGRNNINSYGVGRHRGEPPKKHVYKAKNNKKRYRYGEVIAQINGYKKDKLKHEKGLSLIDMNPETTKRTDNK